MDVSHPIAAVTPSLDGPVLEVLARTSKPLTGRQIHRLTRSGSEAGVRKVLTRLVDQGLVRVTQAGQALLYAPNRDHVAWPAVEQLTRLRTEFFQRMRSELRAWRISPTLAAWFGSSARADGDTSSDIDLLLVRPHTINEEKRQWVEQISALREHILAWTGNRAQIYEISEEDLCQHVRHREPILNEWQRDAVQIYGPEVKDFLHSLNQGGNS